MPGTLDHALDAGCPCTPDQSAERNHLGKHRRVAGIRDAARTHAIAEAERDIVLTRNLEQIIVFSVKRILAIMVEHPCDGERSAAAHHIHYATALYEAVDHVPVYARVDRHKIHAALCMAPDRIKKIIRGHIWQRRAAADRTIYRDRANGRADRIKNTT